MAGGVDATTMYSNVQANFNVAVAVLHTEMYDIVVVDFTESALFVCK